MADMRIALLKSLRNWEEIIEEDIWYVETESIYWQQYSFLLNVYYAEGYENDPLKWEE